MRRDGRGELMVHTDCPLGPRGPVAPWGPGGPRGPGKPGAPAIPAPPCEGEAEGFNLEVSQAMGSYLYLNGPPQRGSLLPSLSVS